jgi:DNA-binding MarR family transcriptional regulator
MSPSSASLALLTNHARLLVAVARSPQATMRELGDAIGITERAAHRLMSDLCAAGYVERRREGRCNVYEVASEVPIRALARISDSGSRPSHSPRAA